MSLFNYSKDRDKINSQSFQPDILTEIARTWTKAKEFLKKLNQSKGGDNKK